MDDQTERHGLVLKSVEPRGRPVEPSRSSDMSRPTTEGISRNQTGPHSRSPTNEVDVPTMIVGSGMSLCGTINSCNRLIVEGTIDATLDNCQHMIVGETGVFRGDASTENADVYGRLEGQLIVRKRLLVRATGQVSGTITYGEIEIECGGKLSGDINVQDGLTAVSPGEQLA